MSDDKHEKRAIKNMLPLLHQPRNPTRLAAIEQLMDKPMSVNELALILGQEQSMISHNLKPLLQCNLITVKKEGKKHIYTVNEQTLQPNL